MKLDVRCTRDIVIDTNVLSHAGNSGVSEHGSSLKVVDWMRRASVIWVLDDQGKNAPDPQTSVLYKEYLDNLQPQSFALQVFMQCLTGQRVRFARRPGRADQEMLRKLIPKNNSDRAVLGAALGSLDRLLVSNDRSDFPDSVRKEVKRYWKVEVLASIQLD